ncbi:MAG: DUF3330 domain-containing protein [Gallionella sp.]|nr:DUF3330 domain-containing protein [Gallionella sp.]
MANESDPFKDKKISCPICHKEVPLSEAKSAEAVDYVAYFCGLECYTEWKQKSEQAGLQSNVAKKR